jgi:hypothetical protein
MVSRIILGNSGLSVGSPSPEKVMESIEMPAFEHSDNFFSNAFLTSEADGSVWSLRPSLFHPHSQ